MKPQNLITMTTLVIVFVAAACAKLSELTDAENRLILSDVSFAADSSSTGETAEENPTPPNDSKRGKCRGNPLMDACKTDAETYCASSIPEKPTPGQCNQQSFEARRDKMHELVDCLQTNVASLSTACQTAVAGIPAAPPEEDRQVSGGQSQERPPHPKPPRECGGESVLRVCISDAQSLCPSQLPADTEIANFTPEERRANVKAIVDCLKTQLTSVTAECKKAIDQLPPPPPAE